jgi:hypothetical protein
MTGVPPPVRLRKRERRAGCIRVNVPNSFNISENCGRFAALCVVAAGLAGCETTANAPSGETVAVAFEGLVGVPQEIGDRLTAELGRAANDRRIAIVPARETSARWVVRGYFAPQTVGSDTVVGYVWDVFDRSGRRAQRLAGDVRLAGATAESWAQSGAGGTRALASAGAAALERFVFAPQPTGQPTAPTAAQAPQPPAERGPVASRRLAIGELSGLDSAQAAALRAGLRRALGELGYAIVEPDQPADARLAADITLNPPEAGRQMLALVWHVNDGRGTRLGEVRQMTKVADGTMARRADPVLHRAIDEMLPGLVALAPPSR